MGGVRMTPSIGSSCDGEYRALAPDAGGVVESQRFPGLRLPVDALLTGDVATVLAELRRGLDSPAHAKFVAGLAAAAQR